jgi:hypothetical protein
MPGNNPEESIDTQNMAKVWHQEGFINCFENSFVAQTAECEASSGTKMIKKPSS